MKITLHKFIISFFVILFGLFSLSFAQNSLEEGVSFYNQGKYKKAIESLNKAINTEENKVKVFHYLGLAFESEQNLKKVSANHKLAVDACIQLIKNSYQEKLLKPNSKKSVTQQIREELNDEITLALKSVQRQKKLGLTFVISSEQRSPELILNFFSKKITHDPIKTKTNLSLTFKPRPASPIDLDRFRVVIVSVLFLSNGKIGLVIPNNWDNKIVTQAAIEAAKKIEFTPATRNGKPVSIIKRVQYNFTVF